jgi:plastocyanin
MRCLGKALLFSFFGLALSGCPDRQPEPPSPAPSPAEPVAIEPLAAATEPALSADEVPVLQPGEVGTIRGAISFEGPVPHNQPLKRGADPVCARGEVLDQLVLVKDGKLQNVVVRLKNAPPAPPPDEPVVLDQLECIYLPRVQAAMKGQSLKVKNSDGTIHNVHTYEGTKTWFNVAQPPRGRDIIRPMDREGIVKFKCDVHPWMVAYIVLSTHPYFATTGDDGSFNIENVPAGTYTLEAWHERFGTKSQEVTVSPGEPTEVRFAFKFADR